MVLLTEVGKQRRGEQVWERKTEALKFGYAECEMPLRHSKEDLAVIWTQSGTLLSGANIRALEEVRPGDLSWWQRWLHAHSP